MTTSDRFRRRFLKRWLLRRSVLSAAAAAGLVTAAAVTVGLLGGGGLAAAAGVGLLAWAVPAAVAAGWFVFGRQRIAAEARAGLLDEADGGQRQLLRELGRRLIGHGDSEGARLADALRKLRGRLDAGVAGEGFEVDAAMAGTAERLMSASVNALARSLRIHQAKEQLHTEEVKEELDGSRAGLIAEVASGVHALGLMLDRMQTAKLRRPMEGELLAVRAELDSGLAVAERVEARMAALDASLSGPSAVRER
ncbi:hypothetical protein [Phycisphaera mikurensis]|uniref:Uncharacterized protein n=1 Tax=Phycisphaera mikurensis (strain NBRC 102666 / KCTC 22515 / FYK2301M01) TaxID=1142394 RepID=I0IB53_PHYMF|nr:hypothetical protein [Phycisphaera mikurensis]MBB6442992.1 hypothetical protein [Phycisphaera mikurensis]BAM02491.1 hypothetical protein PSMK_03320 [Phycisphaera mikurensis NBRC 102666]